MQFSTVQPSWYPFWHKGKWPNVTEAYMYTCISKIYDVVILIVHKVNLICCFAAYTQHLLYVCPLSKSDPSFCILHSLRIFSQLKGFLGKFSAVFQWSKDRGCSCSIDYKAPTAHCDIGLYK